MVNQCEEGQNRGRTVPTVRQTADAVQLHVRLGSVACSPGNCVHILSQIHSLNIHAQNGRQRTEQYTEQLWDRTGGTLTCKRNVSRKSKIGGGAKPAERTGFSHSRGRNGFLAFKNGFCEITQRLLRLLVEKFHRNHFYKVRTHFYHDASTRDKFCDCRVVEKWPGTGVCGAHEIE